MTWILNLQTSALANARTDSNQIDSLRRTVMGDQIRSSVMARIEHTENSPIERTEDSGAIVLYCSHNILTLYAPSQTSPQDTWQSGILKVISSLKNDG
jgi:hypothetical protein